jgi:dCTP deaminase
MILSDREIQAAIGRGAVKIHPPPPDLASEDPKSKKSRWSSTTLDLRLASEIIVWNAADIGADVKFEPPDEEGFDYQSLVSQYAKKLQIPPEGYSFGGRETSTYKPVRFILGWTHETIQIPATSRLAARVEGKSSLARLGIGVHLTAPTIHAGFGVSTDDKNYAGSQLQLEIFSYGDFPVKLKPLMKICQLIFEEVHGTPTKGYEQGGRFSVQGAQKLPPK